MARDTEAAYCNVSAGGSTMDHALEELDKRVNQRLQEGWQLRGAVIIHSYHVDRYYYAAQTMIMTEEQVLLGKLTDDGTDTDRPQYKRY